MQLRAASEKNPFRRRLAKEGGFADLILAF